ncbi:MAG: hypothetical protein ACOYMF_05315 [Bacteroidales bacterium]
MKDIIKFIAECRARRSRLQALKLALKSDDHHRLLEAAQKIESFLNGQKL